jgi:hypothetical protein
MSINVPKFQTKTETEIKNYEMIKSVLTKLYETEMDLNKKRKGIFDDIAKINEENANLKQIYENFTKTMKILEENKDNQIMNIKTKLIPNTDYYISEAKKTKQDIGNYKNIKSKTEKQAEEIDNMRKSGINVKGSQISQNMLQNKSTMNDLGETIEGRMMKYEYERITNNKLIMLHLINYEMAYHAEAIKMLTNLFKDVKTINPKKSINESLRSLNMSKKIEEKDEEDDDDNEEKEGDEESDEDDNKDKSIKKSKNKSKKENEDDSKEIDDDNDDE